MQEIPFIQLDDKNSSVPLYRQIYEAVRRAILSGEFTARMRLPASRLLANQLGVSRMTVINAYEQLYAEGYLEGKLGAGTFVAARLPEEFLQAAQTNSEKKIENAPRRIKLSAYGEKLSESDYVVWRNQRPSRFLPFQHGVPAVDKFPFDVWWNLAQKRQKNSLREIHGYGEPAGFYPLREAVAAHLRTARGVKCVAEQIIITNGTQQAVDLIARVLLEAGDKVWMEEPCYLGARDVFTSVGAKISHVDVDAEGFNVEQARRQSRPARLVYITPSHQFPTGATMSLARRLNLLEWAQEDNEAWILEDDYDSEYRYAGRPLAALQGLDRDGRVIYIGTFSKTVFPALRLGCMVVPKDLVRVFCAARALSDVHSPILNQAVLADFISEGHFARHIRRMRFLYEKRRNVLVEAIEKNLGGRIEVQPANAGMHVIGWLPETVDDCEISRKARRSNLTVAPLSAYCNRPPKRGALIFGYTAFDEEQIDEGVKKLAMIL